ncbi:MAG: sigma-70 family RNA polymerase sigma factor [Elusimicrobiota bacterium]
MNTDTEHTKSESEQDRELIARAAGNNVTAFEELIKKYELTVYGIARAFMGNDPDAADLAQDVFIKIFKSLKSFRHESAFSTWLYRIVYTTFVDYKKSGKAKNIAVSVPIDDAVNIAAPGDDPGISAQKEQVRDIVSQALLMIPENFRLPVIMYDIQRFDYQEIAEITKTNLGTVKSRINRGREMLRKKIVENWGNIS